MFASGLLVTACGASAGSDRHTAADGAATQHASTSAAVGAPGGASATAVPGNATVCPELPDTDQSQLTSANSFARSDLAWHDFHGYQLPESTKSGPAQHSGDVARCYAHTPRGAVLALAQTSPRSAGADDWRSVIAQQVASGPERDAFLQSVAAHKTDSSPASQAGADIGQYAGFQVVSYTADTAVVDFAIKFPTGLYRTVVLTAVWQDGDWKQKMTADGQQSNKVSEQRTLIGYIPFSSEG